MLFVARRSITSVLLVPREVARRSIKSVLHVPREVARRSGASRACCTFQEKLQGVASRACCTFQEKLQGVASRASKETTKTKQPKNAGDMTLLAPPPSPAPQKPPPQNPPQKKTRPKHPPPTAHMNLGQTPPRLPNMLWMDVWSDRRWRYFGARSLKFR